MSPRELTRQEAADLLGVTVQSISKYVSEGKLPRHGPRRQALFWAEDVEKLRANALPAPGEGEYTISEAARELGIAQSTLSSRISSGHVRVTRRGRGVFISAEEIELLRDFDRVLKSGKADRKMRVLLDDLDDETEITESEAAVYLGVPAYELSRQLQDNVFPSRWEGRTRLIRMADARCYDEFLWVHHRKLQESGERRRDEEVNMAEASVKSGLSLYKLRRAIDRKEIPSRDLKGEVLIRMPDLTCYLRKLVREGMRREVD